jgi:hypothetical protein
MKVTSLELLVLEGLQYAAYISLNKQKLKLIIFTTFQTLVLGGTITSQSCAAYAFSVNVGLQPVSD